MKPARYFVASFAFFVIALCSFAADISGQWTATFDSLAGQQHYTYTFKVEGDKLTGTAKSASGTVTIHDGSVKGDDVSFVEDLNFQGQKIAIKYTGKIQGDSIEFTRKVGNLATEDLVAKRAH